MAVHLRTTGTTDPMLIGINERKESAFLEVVKYLQEAQLRLGELDTEIGAFKNRVIKVGEEYRQSENSLPPVQVLIRERADFLEEYQGFMEVYIKASILAYKTIETINYLQPAYRIESEVRRFQEHLPDFYAQVQQSEKKNLEQIDKLQKMFTNVLHQKSIVLKLIEDRSLTEALEKLRSLIGKNEFKTSRASKLLSYVSYALTPAIQEPLTAPEKIRTRSALTKLNIDAIPTFSATQTPSLNRRTSISPSRDKYLSSEDSLSPPTQRQRSLRVSASSPRSLTFSSGTSSYSPRKLFLTPRAPIASKNVHHSYRSSSDSMETISLSTSSPRDAPSPRNVRYGHRSSTDSWETVSLSTSSPRKLPLPNTASSRHTYSSYSPRNRGYMTSSRDSISPREIHSSYILKNRGVTFSSEKTSSRQFEIDRSNLSNREPLRDKSSDGSVYRSSLGRKSSERGASTSSFNVDQGRYKPNSLKSRVQQKWEGKSYHWDSTGSSSYGRSRY